MIERYRHWYEHEIDSNGKMLAMLESVPEAKRSSAEFRRALKLAGHLAACRENWLIRLTADVSAPSEWWPESTELESLSPRYERLHASWKDYLSSLSDDDIAKDFDFKLGSGAVFHWNVEEQLTQLVGHAFYHRGQIALLVDGLGGETVDTDYLYWEFDRNPRFYKVDPVKQG